MTPPEAPTEALVDALQRTEWADEDISSLELAADLAKALTKLGWTLAPSQDAEDGRELRLLREALPRHTVLNVSYANDDPKVWVVRVAGPKAYGQGLTVTEAARKCRERLEG